MTALKIDHEFHKLIPPHTQAEYDQLEQNLLADGCIDPLALWNQNVIIDGHNRYEICKKHGIEFSTVNIDHLETREDVEIWIIHNQLGRRNLSDFDRVELALRVKPIIEAKAKEKQKKGAVSIAVRPISDEGVENPTPPPFGSLQMRTDQAIADLAGVGKNKVRQVEQIQAKGTAETIAAVKAKEISINKAAAVAKKPKAQQAKALAEAKEKKPRQEVQHDEPGMPADQKEREATLLESIRLQAEENTELRDRLAIEGSDLGEEGKVDMIAVVADLRKKLAAAEANFEACKNSRDQLLRENSSLKTQCTKQRKEIEKLKKGK